MFSLSAGKEYHWTVLFDVNRWHRPSATNIEFNPRFSVVGMSFMYLTLFANVKSYYMPPLVLSSSASANIWSIRSSPSPYVDFLGVSSIWNSCPIVSSLNSTTGFLPSL